MPIEDIKIKEQKNPLCLYHLCLSSPKHVYFVFLILCAHTSKHAQKKQLFGSKSFEATFFVISDFNIHIKT